MGSGGGEPDGLRLCLLGLRSPGSDPEGRILTLRHLHKVRILNDPPHAPYLVSQDCKEVYLRAREFCVRRGHCEN